MVTSQNVWPLVGWLARTVHRSTKMAEVYYYNHFTKEEFDAVDAEWDEEDKAIGEFRAKWPNRCKACGAWGRPCDALPTDTCHRCQARAMMPFKDGKDVCCMCGWIP